MYRLLKKHFRRNLYLRGIVVTIEKHTDKYVGTWRQDDMMIDTTVLFSILEDGDEIIPIQIEIKRKTDLNYGAMYMYVAMNGIENRR